MLGQSSRALVLAIGALALSGCTTMDGVAESAINANLELEQVQNKTLLLNVVRASLRRPPVYQTLQNITGSVRPNADLSLSVPFGVNVSAANSTTLSLKGNEGPKITAAPLDTQEFMQGVMAPLKISTIDFYIQQGYSRALLFNLFFSRIEILQGRSSVAVFKNYPGDDKDLLPFQRLVDRLVRNGLTAESVGVDGTVFGPLRADADVRALASTAQAATAGLEIKEVSWCTITKEEWRRLAKNAASKEELDALDVACKDNDPANDQAAVEALLGPSPRPFYRVAKPSSAKNARFCFGVSGAKGAPRSCANVRSTSSGVDALVTSSTLVDGIVPEGNLKSNLPIQISIVPRSTDGVVYYLGEVARRALAPDSTLEIVAAGKAEEGDVSVAPGKVERPGKKRAIAYRYKYFESEGEPTNACPLMPAEHAWIEGFCRPVLWVSDRKTPNAFVSVEYEGVTYVVPGSGSEGERSSQVFGIVSQLLALNKAAKDQPTTSILNVVNP